MKIYTVVPVECEAQLLASGTEVTIVRPWYVLGPRHRWPYVLLPMYRICERIPATRDDGERLGLITLTRMVRTPVSAVEIPSIGGRFTQVPQILTGSVPA